MRSQRHGTAVIRAWARTSRGGGAGARGRVLLLAALIGALATPAGACAQGAGADSGVEWRAGGTRVERVAEVPSGAAHEAMIADLRGGGFVLFCRHGHTDRSRGDTGPGRHQQRLLSERGEAESRGMGEALRRQGVPVGEVFTSPMFRALDSAELSFGEAVVEDALRSRQAGDRLKELLTSAPASGTNRVLMSHQWLIRPVTGIGRAGTLEEGDCLIVEPTAGGSAHLRARVGATDWEG